MRRVIPDQANAPLAGGLILTHHEHGFSQRKAVLLRLSRNTELRIHLPHQGKMTLIPRQSGAKAFLQMVSVLTSTLSPQLTAI
jgi:hypothetical protein